MKKMLYLPLLCLLFLMPFKVKASYLPPVLPNTSVLPSFLENVAQYQIISEEGVYMNASDVNTVNQMVNGRSISDSLQYVYLDNSTINTELSPFYTINGVNVSQGDTYTVYASSDVGQLMFVCDKSTGEILYQGESGSLHSTLVGSSDSAFKEETFPEWVVRELSGSASSNINNVLNLVNEAKTNDNCIIFGNNLSNADKEFLKSYEFYFNMTTGNGWSVFVPNACSSNTIVHLYSNQNNNSYEYHGEVGVNDRYVIRPIVYTNNPNEVYFSGTGSGVGLIQAQTSVYGKTYSYCSNTTYPFINGGSLDCKLPSLAQYNTYKNASENSIYLIPTEPINEPTNNYYNYTYVTENPPDNVTNVNNHYNTEGDTNYYNYPVYNTFTYPSYPTTTNNYTTQIYNYYTTPQEGENIGSIADPVLPENIPILSNLQYRFPFSIPFDLYKMLKGLSVPRETPSIDTVVVIPRINYEWHIQYDLSEFENVASIFRTLILISYIVGLALFSYRHFFGQ